MTNSKKNKEQNSEINLSDIFEETNNNIVNAKSLIEKSEEIKKTIDIKIEELNTKKIDLAKKTKEDYLKIKEYKEEAMNKIAEKKQDLDKKIETFKTAESSLKEKFNSYKDEELKKLKVEKEEIKKLREELDKERKQLDTDRKQYEKDKNNLATSLLKFNELVSNFTVNIDQIK